MKKNLFVISILIPILALFFLTIKKAYTVSSGEKFELNIAGFDPIDLLSGHYVTYRVDYGFDPCYPDEVQCICVEKNSFTTYATECGSFDCKNFIKGKCIKGRFKANLEKYFIPEDKAEEIDRIVRIGKSRVRFSLDKQGNAIVEDLILVEEE
ncbi:MAG: GDYXXLXY domain-containing protein [Leptospiraceae bacterium]|nr:GDYXXLXY domain-containing protein [Leptospiraceae bacterium]